MRDWRGETVQDIDKIVQTLNEMTDSAAIHGEGYKQQKCKKNIHVKCIAAPKCRFIVWISNDATKDGMYALKRKVCLTHTPEAHNNQV